LSCGGLTANKSDAIFLGFTGGPFNHGAEPCHDISSTPE
jgi:hypothetical protein